VDLRQKEEGRRRGGVGERAGQLDRLLADLAHADATRRDAAVARLRVMGPRTLPHLTTLIGDAQAPPVARAAALSVLEAFDDTRVIALSRTALKELDTDVALAAIGVLRGWLTREDGTHALEAITAAALDKRRDGSVRLAALDALSELPPELVAPIRERAPVDGGDRPALDDPASCGAWIAEHGTTAPLSALHDAVVGARERELRESAGRRRDEWTRMRGAAHLALAQRGSRVALYDLRESFDQTKRPLPADFLAAAARVGDESCLEPLARAWAGAKGEPWWRSRLMETAADVVGRLKLTGRHATLKRVREKWKGFV
jgi:hypothetical protein